MDVLIRCVGMSSSVSAHSCFTADLRGRLDGIYGAFIGALSAIDPAAVRNCACYTSPTGTSIGAFRPLHTSITDIKEQALFQAFGFETLLNRQPGGIHASYVPSQKDVLRSQKLKTKAFRRLEDLATSASYRKANTKERSDVNLWMHNVMALGKRYPEVLGTDSVRRTDATEVAWAQQATLEKLYAHVVPVWVGDYCPLHAILEPANLWSGKARRVRLRRTLLLDSDKPKQTATSLGITLT